MIDKLESIEVPNLCSIASFLVTLKIIIKNLLKWQFPIVQPLSMPVMKEVFKI